MFPRTLLAAFVCLAILHAAVAQDPSVTTVKKVRKRKMVVSPQSHSSLAGSGVVPLLPVGFSSAEERAGKHIKLRRRKQPQLAHDYQKTRGDKEGNFSSTRLASLT
jgi:hypothetical protein